MVFGKSLHATASQFPNVASIATAYDKLKGAAKQQAAAAPPSGEPGEGDAAHGDPQGPSFAAQIYEELLGLNNWFIEQEEQCIITTELLEEATSRVTDQTLLFHYSQLLNFHQQLLHLLRWCLLARTAAEKLLSKPLIRSLLEADDPQRIQQLHELLMNQPLCDTQYLESLMNRTYACTRRLNERQGIVTNPPQGHQPAELPPAVDAELVDKEGEPMKEDSLCPSPGHDSEDQPILPTARANQALKQTSSVSNPSESNGHQTRSIISPAKMIDQLDGQQSTHSSDKQGASYGRLPSPKQTSSPSGRVDSKGHHSHSNQEGSKCKGRGHSRCTSIPEEEDSYIDDDSDDDEDIDSKAAHDTVGLQAGLSRGDRRFAEPQPACKKQCTSRS